jgi:hypothetical protein
MRICPGDLTHLRALTEPFAKSIKVCFEHVSIVVANKVDKSIAEVHTSAKVNRKVDKVIPPPISIAVKQLHKAI